VVDGIDGSGKSTLLKILSRITEPTSGRITIDGRVASLLEVGTGFHPELTGRENIFLNGVILGMTRKEVAEKFDEIVDFSGIEKCLDTPAKHYSSGMYTRLGFAVAAHLETEVLLVDEVLAVGDASFQKKCLDKMDDIAKQEGRTVLFVSHNLAAIQSLCRRVLLLDAGRIRKIGAPREVIEEYLSSGASRTEKLPVAKYHEGGGADAPIYIDDIHIQGHQAETPVLNMGEIPTIIISVVARRNIERGNITLALYNVAGVKTDMAFSWDDDFYLDVKEGRQEIAFTPRDLALPPGRYSLSVGLNQSTNTAAWDIVSYYPIFEVENQGQVASWSSRPWAIHHSQDNKWQLNNL